MLVKLQKVTSLSLAALYALLAIAGHALHDHGYVANESSLGIDFTEAQTSCNCHHHHCEEAPQQPYAIESANPDGLTLLASSKSTECLACALLGQISLGYSFHHDAATTPTFSSKFVGNNYNSPYILAIRNSTSERGPPCVIFA